MRTGLPEVGFPPTSRRTGPDSFGKGALSGFSAWSVDGLRTRMPWVVQAPQQEFHHWRAALACRFPRGTRPCGLDLQLRNYCIPKLHWETTPPGCIALAQGTARPAQANAITVTGDQAGERLAGLQQHGRLRGTQVCLCLFHTRGPSWADFPCPHGMSGRFCPLQTLP